MLALQKQDYLPDHRGILFPVDISDARRVTAVDVVLRAGSRKKLLLPFGWRVRLGAARWRPARAVIPARAIGEELVHEIQRGIHRAGVGIRPKVTIAVMPEAAHAIDAREGILEVHFYVGVALVIAQANVVFRLVALDVLVFEYQRLHLATDDDELHIGNLRHERAVLRA